MADKYCAKLTRIQLKLPFFESRLWLAESRFPPSLSR